MGRLVDAFLLPKSVIDRRFTYALVSPSARLHFPISRIVPPKYGKLLRARSRYTQEAHNVIMQIGEYNGDGMEQRDSTLDQHAESRRPGGEP